MKTNAYILVVFTVFAAAFTSCSKAPTEEARDNVQNLRKEMDSLVPLDRVAKKKFERMRSELDGLDRNLDNADQRLSALRREIEGVEATKTRESKAPAKREDPRTLWEKIRREPIPEPEPWYAFWK